MALPAKDEVYYIIRETGQADKVFATLADAQTEFDLPNVGEEKLAISCTVKFKRVWNVADVEL